MRILIIDKSTTLLRMLGEKFSSEGHTVFTASEMPEALRVLYREQPDIVLAHNRLSCLSPRQLRNIVRLQFVKHIPVLLFRNRKRFAFPAFSSNDSSSLLNSLCPMD
jgi:DNA-binding response OmpR family regulator